MLKSRNLLVIPTRGPILGEDQDTIAHNALVAMAVGLQKPWSYPIAYFLVNHMDSKMQAQIIKESINLLTDAGLDVHAVTFDGCSKNLATARRLGCKIDSFDGSFQHPTRPGKTLYVILDICHMLKLARNALGDKEIFYTSGGETISWYYIKELFNVQQSDILHLGNKLKNVHIKWHNQKMKVAVAAQTLSSSVAAGMIYLRNLNVKQFEKCEQTAEFIQNINDIFDILNTKSKFGKRFKSPLTLENYAELRAHLRASFNIKTGGDMAPPAPLTAPPVGNFVPPSRKSLFIFFGVKITPKVNIGQHN